MTPTTASTRARDATIARAALVGLAGKISRRPRMARCADCGRALIVALEYDGIATGQRFAVDAMPTTPEGELRAFLAGIAAVDHWGDSITARLYYVHRFIPGNSLAVLPVHSCGHAWPVDHGAMARLYRPGVCATDPTEPPPF